jgi:hypothetical protein
MVPTALLHPPTPEGSRAMDFYRPYKSIVFARFEPANLGSSGKHTNYWTTEDDSLDLILNHLNLNFSFLLS